MKTKNIPYSDFSKLPVEERKKMYQKAKQRRPANYPTVFAKHTSCTLPQLPECRTILKENLMILQVKQDIKKYVYAGKNSEKEALFLFHDGLILPDQLTVKEVIEKYNKDKMGDGWFLIKYHNQEIF